MTNRDLQAAWQYHEATKHSPLSVHQSAHFLDWDNQPLPFKIYPTLEPIPLPRETPQTGVAALSAISQVGVTARGVPDLEALALLLYFSAGVTKEKTYRGGEKFFFRAAACTGALFEIELYIVCGDLPGLEAGVYHFGPADFALRRLRSGDLRGVVARATAELASVVHAPLVVICTGTYWRNSWKYQARTYRHFGWDNGTILANLLAMAVALGLPHELVMGFADDELNRLLAVATEREVVFSMVTIGQSDAPAPSAPHEFPPLNLETVPLSKEEVDSPLMREMHAASCLGSPEDVAGWRGEAPKKTQPSAQQAVELQPLSDEAMPRDTIEQVILRRGSTRRFAREPIPFAQLSTMLHRATRGIPGDFLQPAGAQLNDLYLIVNAVEGLAPGAYFFHRNQGTLELLQEGTFRREASYLGLQQELPGDAAASIFYLADLGSVFERYGNRGYRAVQLEAGIIGGKLYLAAYAQRLGATGLTFFDDDVARFFSPHAQGKSAIFLTALGRSAVRRP